MKVKELIQSIVTDALFTAVKDGKLPEGEYPRIKIEYPKEAAYGDYSSPVAMESARVIKRSPVDTGEILKTYIEKSEIVSRVDVIKPGFINIFVAPDTLTGNLSKVLEERGNYGISQEKDKGRVIIEFVSANPTGPLNIVSARAAAIGDTLSNLLDADGYTVHREFYVNDFGNQFNLLGRSVLARYRELTGKPSSFPEDGYHGEYVKDIAVHLKEKYSSEIEAIENDDQLELFMAEKAVEYNVATQKRDLERFNVEFDRWFSERTLHEDDSVESTRKTLIEKGVTFMEEGKTLFKSTDYGDDKDRVIVREDGRPTYLLADIAYHNDKIKRGFSRIIDIWGPDHHGYIARLSGALKALGFPAENFSVLIAQQVNLLVEGETVKMSKRLGNFSTMSDLIDEIGIDVARYFFVMRSLDSHLDFDLELAKRQSSENPVFYLQYAHARICSIFREAEKRGYIYNQSDFSPEYLKNDEAVALLKIIMKYPEEISDAAAAGEPHRITNFLMRLAQNYHRFYSEHRVLDEKDAKTNSYLALCDGVRTVMKNGLSLLGVNAPESM